MYNYKPRETFVIITNQRNLSGLQCPILVPERTVSNPWILTNLFQYYLKYYLFRCSVVQYLVKKKKSNKFKTIRCCCIFIINPKKTLIIVLLKKVSTRFAIFLNTAIYETVYWKVSYNWNTQVGGKGAVLTRRP